MKLVVIPIVFAVCAPGYRHVRVEESWYPRGSGVASSPGVDPGLHLDAEGTVSLGAQGVIGDRNLDRTWTPGNAQRPLAALAGRGSARLSRRTELGMDLEVGVPGTRLRPEGAEAPNHTPPTRLTTDFRYNLTRGTGPVDVGFGGALTLDMTVLDWRVDRYYVDSEAGPGTFMGEDTRFYRFAAAQFGGRTGLWIEGRPNGDTRLLGGATVGVTPYVPARRDTEYPCPSRAAYATCAVAEPVAFRFSGVIHPWIGFDHRGEHTDFGVRAWGALFESFYGDKFEGGLSVVVRRRYVPNPRADW